VKAKSLISRLNAGELEDYEGVRDFLLSEFKLTHTEYKARFDNATKRPYETFIFFAARLKNNLPYCKGPGVQLPLSPKSACKKSYIRYPSRIADLSVLGSDRSYRRIRHESYLA